MSLCLLAGALAVPLMADTVTLAWSHSVEHVRWEETWQDAPDGLHLVEARVKGSGAGMDPPPEATFKDGFWRWTPHLGPLGEVILRRSGATDDWRVCRDGECVPVGTLVPADADPVRLSPCD
ncbi:DUF1850 domain-containing protein [Acuticoccus sediminis]|uniref:DUF1850 domain-containing protein n=1 Tax=Acuticoccus sediminis TaxID=2184697 RepID=A0A8B2NZ30_9HYPH|nr:DUF1850 domain-containing protein [Acuticoccus sediminis]RAI02602.1 DUF1850 domain-containing protein [Acuticoccus sediminis]